MGGLTKLPRAHFHCWSIDRPKHSNSSTPQGIIVCLVLLPIFSWITRRELSLSHRVVLRVSSEDRSCCIIPLFTKLGGRCRLIGETKGFTVGDLWTIVSFKKVIKWWCLSVTEHVWTSTLCTLSGVRNGKLPLLIFANQIWRAYYFLHYGHFSTSKI